MLVLVDQDVMELRLKDSRPERNGPHVGPHVEQDVERRDPLMHVSPDEIARHAIRRGPALRHSAHTIRSRSWRLRTRIGAWVPSFAKVLTVGLIAGAAWVAMNFESTVPASSQQATVVLTGQDVARWTGAFAYDPTLESTFITRKLMGADSVTCHYDSGGVEPITLTCRAVLHGTEDGAKAAFSLSRVSLLTDFRLDRKGEVGLLEMNDAHSWGDEVRAFQVTEGLNPIGHSFVARKGRRTFYVALQGVVIQPEWSFAALLSARLKAFESFTFEDVKGIDRATH